jgi:2-polyprenyl-3-methyl-5-hydroxy-6-metoxy-1,4-benzoquinol methylase
MIQKKAQEEIQNSNYSYSDNYFEGLLTGWNKTSYPIISKLVKKCLEKYKPEIILDLGCGNGIYFDVLTKYSKNIYGIDASEQSVILCSKKGYRQVKLADATFLPFPDKYFDFVFTSEVLEHVENYIFMLTEINRILKPQGILFLTTTCYSTAIFQLPFNIGISQYLKEIYVYISGFVSKEKRNIFVRKWCFESLGGHFHGFIPLSLKKDLNSIGMSILENKSLYIIPPFPYNPKQLAYSGLSFKKNHSLIKRIVMLFVSFMVSILNPVTKIFGIFSNNVYILAQRN